MKKLLLGLFIGLGLTVGTAYAATVFRSDQVGNSPASGDVLQTNGTISTWVATSTLGISGSLSGGTNGFAAIWSSGSALTVGTLRDNGTVSGVNATSSAVSFNIQGSGILNPLNVSSSTGASIFSVTADGQVRYGNLVSVVHADGTINQYNATTSTDVARGQALVNAMAAAVTGDSVYISANTFDIASSTLDLSLANTGSVNLFGSGKYNTTIKSSYTAALKNIIQLGATSTVADLGIIATVKTATSFPIGSYKQALATTTIENVYIEGSSDGFYFRGSDSGVPASIKMNAVIKNAHVVTLFDAFQCVYWCLGTFDIYDSRFVATATSSLHSSQTARAITLNSTSTINSFNNIAIASGGTIDNQAYGIGTNGVGANGVLNVYGGTANASGTNAYDLYADPPGQLNVTANTVYDVSKASGTIAYLDSKQIIKHAAGNFIAGSNITLTTSTPGYITISSSGALSGGQTGYVPYWTSASTLGNGSFISNGVNSGVNATISTATLLVQGNPGSNRILNVASSSGTSFLAVMPEGKVGIKNQSPTFTLDVTGDIHATGIIYDSSSDAGNLGDVLQSTVTGYNWVATSTLGIGGVSGGSNGYVARFTSPTALSTGVLIDNGVVAGVNATSSTNIFLIQGAGAPRIFNVTSSTGASYLAVQPSGKVGIGNANPSYNLDITGDMHASGILYDSSGSAGTNGSVLKTTGTGYSWVATSTLGISGGSASASGTAGSIQFSDL